MSISIVTHQNRNTYTIHGIYTVILTTDLNGCQGYDTNTIIVDTLPMLTLMLQKFVTMILQYLWTRP